ncbi:MAG: TAT-variant-translocated molybdopterin oxidoreductase [Myxococcota bacterium]
MRLDLEKLRARLSADDAPDQWSSLDQLAGSPEFDRWASAEFPAAWEEAKGSRLKRRGFLELMGASFGLAGLTSACVKQPEESIVTYVRQPEELVPGKPVHYASAFEREGYGTGVVVETHMFRPTHLAGNPNHPDSAGRTDPQTQASVLALWDPDRSRSVKRRGNNAVWSQFVNELGPKVTELSNRAGAGLRILAGGVSSPTLLNFVQEVLRKLPAAQVHHYQPCSRFSMYEGARQAFGEALEVRYDLSRARTVLSIDADFMGSMPGAIRHQHQLMGRRNDFERTEAWARLYVAEPTPTVGGASADHRMRVRSSACGALVGHIAAQLGVDVRGARVFDDPFVEAAIQDLKQAGRFGAIIVGDDQPPEVHALALAANQKLGAIGSTVVLTQPVLARTDDPQASLRSLVSDMNAGAVDTLIVLDTNVVHSAPPDVDFTAALDKVDLRIHVGPYFDETAFFAHWHVPESHYLERWSDVRATDGTVSIIQPTISPLYPTRSRMDVLGLFIGDDRSDLERVKSHWQGLLGQTGFDQIWQRALHDGVVDGTAFPARFPGLAKDRFEVAAPLDGLELDFDPDPNIGDGRFANNGWLQELPRPLTKLVWDNAVLLSPATAADLGVEAFDQVEVQVGERSVKGGVWVLPGQADEVATVHLGFGRSRGGRVAEESGFDAYPIRASSFVAGSISATGEKVRLACTQDHFRMQGRSLVRSASLQTFERDPAFAQHADHVKLLTLYQPFEYKGHKWGMTINLSSCTGCNSCIVACQSENNISVVGKQEALHGREMHWIRVDRYFTGSVDAPSISFQPVTCMMCENAPCETVCPVNATVHGPEGLNQMVYNRCVGTRYCSNNCPYKVRRFNFRLYSDFETESLKGQKNPDVTIRSRGVMEKCTYCVQRINRASIDARVKRDGELRTDEVRTACQDACPTGAIVFGDLNDENAQVAKNARQPVNYTLLKELNAVPRTTYMARVVNPSPSYPQTREPGHEVHEHER